MTSDSPRWQERHDTIREALQTKSVRAALRDFQISCSTARTLLTAATQEPDTSSSSSDPTPLALGKLLDISLVIAWSAGGIPPAKDPNPFRSAALPSLASLRTASLQVQDFKSVKVLQKSAGSLVEVVKSRLDGRIYVLKSLVKGFARRNAAIQTPINETKLLQRPDSAATSISDQGLQLLTPQLLAAFQTQNSVHVLMEYVPSGDFSELLLAASNCDAEYPGRASTGLLTEDWILRYSVDMVQAIAWVHGQGFAHRDIKPGNFLLDRSGHLKLCDFSSAAPFSEFDSTEVVGRNTTARRPSYRTVRRVWSFYCSQPTGTCDYLSPEVLEAEERRVLERQQQVDMSSLDDILGPRRNGLLHSRQDPGKMPEKLPGMYGPEIDWWSFGAMLYEMRFGVLPFFANRMEETYEKIKDHRSSLSFDPSVACSISLRNFIQSFLTDADHRLGRKSSQEVQQNGFFQAHEIDWSKQWPMEPPFLPNASLTDSHSPDAPVDGSSHHQEAKNLAARLQDNSLSVVSTLPSFSALYSGNPDDFPAFNDSRELGSESYCQQQSWCDGERSAGQGPGHVVDAALNDNTGRARADEIAATIAPDTTIPSLPRSSSSPAVVTGSTSQSFTLRDTSVSKGCLASPNMARSAPRWSDCDATFVGFSYLPHRDAFQPVPQGNVSPGQLSTAASLENVACEFEISPSGWPASTPVASTPFHRSGEQSSQTLSMLPTPPSFAPSPVGPAPVAVSSAEAVGARHSTRSTRSPAIPSTQQHNFVTPARKPSYMAIHERFRQQHGQEAPIPEEALVTYTPAVPASPYPFPMASAARASKFTASKKSVLNRRDLDRARSATPGGGSVGSDSRQSGGSNAVREMSEREAWDEMMAAVQRSVRKKQPPAFVPPTPATRPASVPRSSTDPQLSTSKLISTQPSRQPQLQSTVDVQDSRRSSRRALHSLAAPRQAADRMETVSNDVAVKHTNATQPSGTLRQQRSIATLVAPRATVKVVAPDSPERSPAESPRYGAFAAAQYALDIDMYDSDGSDDSLAARRSLKHKKSTRQLLIRAQERGTPTKPKRAQSPPLTETFAPAPSVAAVLEAAGARSSSPLLLSDQSIRSCTSSRDISYEHGADFASAPARKRSVAVQRSDKASPEVSTEALSSSLGKNSVTFAPMVYVPVLGAIPPWRDARDGPGSSDGHSDPLGPSRETGRNGKTLRRKDSGEMLSQYRKAKGMGRVTSMLSLSDRAKADAENAPSRPGTASAVVPSDGDVDDDFILGHVESRMRSMIQGGSLPGRTIRRFSSVLSLKDREQVTIERPASQDGAAKTGRGFGRFRSRLASSMLCEEAGEEQAVSATKGIHDRSNLGGDSHRNRKSSNTSTEDQENKYTTLRLGRRMGETLPRSFGLRNSSALPASSAALAKKTALNVTVETAQEGDSPGKADVSLMTGLNHRHNALQGSLLGLEHRLARLKARLED